MCHKRDNFLHLLIDYRFISSGVKSAGQDPKLVALWILWNITLAADHLVTNYKVTSFHPTPHQGRAISPTNVEA